MANNGIRPEEVAMFNLAVPKSCELDTEPQIKNEKRKRLADTEDTSISDTVEQPSNVGEHMFTRALKKSRESYKNDALARLRREFADKEQLAAVLKISAGMTAIGDRECLSFDFLMLL
jgi:hypothetical protein